MDTFEIKDEEVNAESIMEKIRQNLEERGHIFSLIPHATTSDKSFDLWESMYPDWQYLNASWDIIHEKYSISSHRPIIGPLLVQGRKIWGYEARLYVNEVMGRQNLFNASLVRLINSQIDRFNFLDKEIDQLRNEIFKQLTDLQLEFNNRLRHLDQNSEVFSALKGEIIRRELETNYNINNLKAEFNSKIDDLKSKSKSLGWNTSQNFVNSKEEDEFVNYFKSCNNGISISFEDRFIKVINQKGVNINDFSITEKKYLSFSQLDTIFAELIKFLEHLENDSYDCFFLEHIEYLQPAKLTQLILLCREKMSEDAYFIIKTINPSSFNNFIDISGKLDSLKPIHPEALKYLLQLNDFTIVDIQFTNYTPNDDKFIKIKLNNPESLQQEEMVNTYNQNIDRLNDIVYAANNYFILGRK